MVFEGCGVTEIITTTQSSAEILWLFGFIYTTATIVTRTITTNVRRSEKWYVACSASEHRMRAKAGRCMSAVCAILENSAKVPKCHWKMIVYAFLIRGSERLIAPHPSEILYSPLNCQNSTNWDFLLPLIWCLQLIIALCWQSKPSFSALTMSLSTVSVTLLANVIQYSYTWTLNLVYRIAAEPSPFHDNKAAY